MKMTATFPKYLYKIQKLYTVIGHPKSFFKQKVINKIRPLSH